MFLLPTPPVAAVPPLAPLSVQREFLAPPREWMPGHRGVDLDARPGVEVHSPWGGQISFVGRVVDRRVVSVTHGTPPLVSSFEPVRSRLRVGQWVSAGGVVGVVQQSEHCVDCLHWGIRDEEGRYLDPMAWVLPARAPMLVGAQAPLAPPSAARPAVRSQSRVAGAALASAMATLTLAFGVTRALR